MFRSLTETRPFAAMTALTILLTGCGGGGGGGTEADSSSSAPVATAPASAATSTTPPAADSSSSAAEVNEAVAATAAEVSAAKAAAAAASAVLAEAVAQASADTTPVAASAGTSEVIVAAPEPGTLSTVQGGAAVPDATPSLTVRARADLAGGIGALMTLRIDGVAIGSVEVKSTALADYKFSAPTLRAGAKVDVVYTNDGQVSGVDRNLYVAYLSDGTQMVPPSASGATIDKGAGAKAFDGLDVVAGQGEMWWSGALRLTWPTAATSDANLARKYDAVRFLQQASFGATATEVDKLLSQSYAAWIDAQMALAYTPDFVNHIQAKYALGSAWRPQGASYTPTWVAQKFWERAANAPDQLRKRVAFALHQIFMVSQVDSNLYYQGRAYAAYVDLLNKNAFGNFRTLLEDMALSPAMGIYLSHMRNRKEDATTGRMPDENFARELMQLFTIGLYELNIDGSLKRDASGNPIETYGNADVVAMAKVFTGWGWAYPDNQLTEANFRWNTPSVTAANDTQYDLLPMKAYAAFHSTAEKKLFAGKSWATTLPAGNSAQADLKAALDLLFNHPNVGPFIGRQLIQRLTTSHPSAAYVGRVAAVFNNNGKGVRGDLAAVVRAVLLDAEARATPAAGFGKLREPVLRVAQWMRFCGAKSSTGDFMMHWELENQSQRAMAAPSVFSYFRPGYVPANTSFASAGSTVPEFQLVNESTVAAWINSAEAMAGWGLGWTGSASDVSCSYATQAALASGNNLAALPDQLNLLLLGGRMPAALRQQILDTVASINASSSNAALNRARAAVFLTLASPDYVFQP